ncbi:MAG: glycosyltransferase family 2 protein [Ruminococcus sp.]|nr:glycosyltransferase family 2 protein [Ruminococcus sp.]
MSKLVSIVLPVYNGAKYLRESIESVIAQTYTNWELLILDDCSTDETSEISKEYAEKDSRIKYFLNEVNLRLPRNLNKGFSLAQGEYLTWTSDDNNFRPTALEKMVNALESDEAAQFVYASCRIIDDDGKEIEYIMVNDNGKNSIVGGNPVGACFLYTRKVYETVGDYNHELILVEDFDYWQRIFMAFKVIAVTDILYNYRMHSGNLTNTMRKDQFNINLEKTLLNNVKGFGKLNYLQKYYYYMGLNRCRKNLNAQDNPYKTQYKFYKFLYILAYKVPNKIKRIVKKSR